MRAGTSCTSVPSWTKIRYEDKVQYEGCDEEYQCPGGGGRTRSRAHTSNIVPDAALTLLKSIVCI